MKRTLILLVVFCLVAACSDDDCDQHGCAVTSQPSRGTSISQGFAGAASHASDAVINGCAECPLGRGILEVWTADAPVATKTEAVALIVGGPATRTITFEGMYEQAFDSGHYLVCADACNFPSPFGGMCAPITVETGAVTTVHVRYAFGPTRLVVFDSGSSVARTDLFDLESGDIGTAGCGDGIRT